MRSPAVRPCGATRARLLTAPLLAATLPAFAAPPELPILPNQVLIQGAPAVAVPLPLPEPEAPTVWSYRLTTSRTDLLELPRVELAPDGRRYAVLAPKSTAGTGTTLVTLAVAEGTVTNTTTFACTVRPAEFGLATNWLSGSVSGRIASAVDLSQDGLMDLLTVPASGSTAVVLLNRPAPGRVLTAPQAGSASQLQQVAWADWDGDGDADSWLRGNPGNSFLQSLNGRLTSTTFPTDTLNFSGGAWADFDADGRVELLVTSVRPNRTTDPVPAPRLLRRDAGGVSELSITLPPTAAPPVVTDFDGDGLPDVWLANSTHSTNGLVFRNEGALQFSPSPLVTPLTPGFAVAAAGWTDFTGDGHPDLWLVESNRFIAAPRRVLSLFARAGDTFAPAHRWEQDQFAAGSPAWADFDGDGLPDFIGSVASPTLHWFTGGPMRTNHFVLLRNTGRGFEPGDFLALVDGNARLATPAVMDANADGTPDVWVATQQGRALIGRYVEQNLPPNAPTGLRTFVSGLSVLFLWNPAGDPNQAAPLTYNLRVGSHPGGNDLVASLTGTNSVRLVMDHGNCGFQTFRLVHLPNLDVDELYWSVQAVDHGFLGGPFAPEQHLPLSIPGNERPVITGLTNVVMDEDTTLTLRYVVTDDRTRPENLTLRVFTSNPALFPDYTSLSGHPARATHTTITTNRFLRLVPATDASGEGHFTVVVTDRVGLSTTNTILVTVRPVNDRPMLEVLSHLDTLRGRPSPPLLISVADVETPAKELRVTAISANPALVTDEGIVLSGSGSNQTMIVNPVATATGTATVRVTVTDGEGFFTDAAVELSFLEQGWTWQQALPTGTPSVVQWADLDNDGTLELVTLGTSEGSGLTIYKRADNGYTTAASLGNESPSRLRIADLDNDGDLDLVMLENVPDAGVGDAPGRNRVYLNRGGLMFHPLLEPKLPQGSVSLADFNGDGMPDIFVKAWTETGPARIELFRNLGEGAFHSSQVLFTHDTGWFEAGFNVIHFDQTGPPVIFSEKDRQAAVFEWVQGSYRERPSPFEGLMPIASANWSFDQTPELLAGNPVSGSYGKVFGWSQDASREDFTAFPASIEGTWVADLDNDGYPDGLAPYNANEPAWRFEPLGRRFVNWLVPWSGGFMGLGDCNGDGLLDMAGYANLGPISGLSIFSGFGLHTNLQPTPPTGLMAIQAGLGAMQLTWALASDPNQPGGLTYNLRLGITPGGNEIRAAESLPDGRRLLPRHGNQGWRTNAIVRGLRPGRTYYWSVQAVDAGFAGGPFAPEQTFTFDGDSAMPALTIGPRVPSGLATLTLRGDPGAPVLLERSTDLRTWQHVTLETLNAAGEFHTAQYSGAETIFYRARYPE